MLGFCLFVWLLFNLLIKKYISPFSLLLIYLVTTFVLPRAGKLKHVNHLQEQILHEARH